MYNIPFSDINAKHIDGDWVVESRQLSTSDPAAVIARALRFIFDKDNFLLLVPEAQGNWALEVEESMKRPYLNINVLNNSWKALITRLFINTDTKDTRLNLYFDTGVELTLIKVLNQPTGFSSKK